MISDELKEITNTLQEQGEMSFLEGATKEQISKFETEHEIKLPEKYKEWLQFSDGGECFLPAALQLYGVAHKPFIDVDDDDRPDDNYIVIGTLATGDPILCQKEGEKISIYNHDADRIEDDEVYDDFFSFMKDLYEILGIGG